MKNFVSSSSVQMVVVYLRNRFVVKSEYQNREFREWERQFASTYDPIYVEICGRS